MKRDEEEKDVVNMADEEMKGETGDARAKERRFNDEGLSDEMEDEDDIDEEAGDVDHYYPKLLK